MLNNPNTDPASLAAATIILASTVSIGVVSGIFSSLTKPEADIRDWGQLPEHIWLKTADAALEDNASLTTQIKYDGQVDNVAFSKLVDSSSCQLYWGRHISPLDSNHGALELGKHKNDGAFRDILPSFFSTPLADE